MQFQSGHRLVCTQATLLGNSAGMPRPHEASCICHRYQLGPGKDVETKLSRSFKLRAFYIFSLKYV